MISDNAEFRQDTDRSNDSQSESEHRGCGENVCQEEPALHVQQTGEYVVLVGHGEKVDVIVDNLTQELGDDLLANKDAESLKDNIDMPGHEITNICLPGGLLSEQEDTLVEKETQAIDSEQILGQRDSISKLERFQLIEHEDALVEEETKAINSEQIFAQKESISRLKSKDKDILKLTNFEGASSQSESARGQAMF